MYLDFHGDRRHRQSPSEFTLKLLADGQEYQSAVTGDLDVHRIPFDGRDVDNAVQATRAAMAAGHPLIARAVLATHDESAGGERNRFGICDLLERVPGASSLGDYHYEPVEIKTARRVKAPYRLQLAFYAHLLAALQGVWPERGHLILADRRRRTFSMDSLRKPFEKLMPRWLAIQEGEEPSIHISGQCTTCPWRGVCIPQAHDGGHLSLVYGLHRRYASVLIDHGLETYHELAEVEAQRIDEMTGCGAPAAERMRGQARALSEGRVIWRRQPDLPRGATEVYFDIEGDPDHDALFLFGLVVREKGREVYRSFVAERPEEEGNAFRACLEYFESLPEATIYHYHHYERSALSRLVERHGVDARRIDSLRTRMVDLNEVVTKSCYLPVPSYSLKTLARYLGFEWSREDSSAVQAVVWFSSWLKSGDRSYLNRAIEYNADDCRATRVLKDWLSSASATNGNGKNGHNGSNGAVFHPSQPGSLA